MAMAQSGRRVRKPVLVPVPTVEPTPPPKPAETPKPMRTFIVGMERFGGFASIPIAVSDSALRSCVERLDDPASVKVELTQGDMTRIEAIDRAKAEKDAHVVWLQIRTDRMTAQSGSGSNSENNIWIEYSVFAPTTAKIVTFGQTYRGNRNRGILRPRTSDIYGDYALNQAAREAAERILSHFKIPVSGRFP